MPWPRDAEQEYGEEMAGRGGTPCLRLNISDDPCGNAGSSCHGLAVDHPVNFASAHEVRVVLNTNWAARLLHFQNDNAGDVFLG